MLNLINFVMLSTNNVSNGGSSLQAGDIAAIVLGVLIPFIAFFSYFITKKLIEKQLRENPPISESQIRAMFASMGRKPSEAQIRNVMNSMKGAKKNKYEKRK